MRERMEASRDKLNSISIKANKSFWYNMFCSFWCTFWIWFELKTGKGFLFFLQVGFWAYFMYQAKFFKDVCYELTNKISEES